MPPEGVSNINLKLADPSRLPKPDMLDENDQKRIENNKERRRKLLSTKYWTVCQISLLLSFRLLASAHLPRRTLGSLNRMRSLLAGFESRGRLSSTSKVPELGLIVGLTKLPRRSYSFRELIIREIIRR